MEKKNVQERYNLPKEIKFCKKCTMSNQRPRIVFDENGVCSACNFAEFKRTKIDWGQREKELVELCNKYRRNDGRYDVLVPCSGGKDGSFVAHQLKYKYNMHPLTVTWASLVDSELGKENLKSFIESGFDNILFQPNQIVKRKMTKMAFMELGDPFQPFIYGQTNFPLRISVQYNIPLIMYGENGEVEYGGDMKNAFKPNREIQDHDKHYFSGMPPEKFKEYGITDSDLYPYTSPSYKEIMDNKTEIQFFSYYKCWDPQGNFDYCKKNTGFKGADERSEGTFTNYASLDDEIDGFHYWLGYIKFGVGRATADAAHEIRDGAITREQGIELVRKFDGEFPQKYFDIFLNYCDITEEQFWEVIDSWRSEHIWEKVHGEWKIKKTVFGNF